MLPGEDRTEIHSVKSLTTGRYAPLAPGGDRQDWGLALVFAEGHLTILRSGCRRGPGRGVALSAPCPRWWWWGGVAHSLTPRPIVGPGAHSQSPPPCQGCTVLRGNRQPF